MKESEIYANAAGLWILAVGKVDEVSKNDLDAIYFLLQQKEYSERMEENNA